MLVVQNTTRGRAAHEATPGPREAMCRVHRWPGILGGHEKGGHSHGEGKCTYPLNVRQCV
jgi:hypothetical protein